jgi:integrase/recombinase XerD
MTVRRWCWEAAAACHGQPKAVSNAIKGVIHVAATTADERDDEDVAAQLRKASAHWLRHSVFTHLANSGVSLKTVQATAGLAKLSTTGM